MSEEPKPARSVPVAVIVNKADQPVATVFAKGAARPETPPAQPAPSEEPRIIGMARTEPLHKCDLIAAAEKEAAR